MVLDTEGYVLEGAPFTGSVFLMLLRPLFEVGCSRYWRYRVW